MTGRNVIVLVGLVAAVWWAAPGAAGAQEPTEEPESGDEELPWGSWDETLDSDGLIDLADLETLELEMLRSLRAGSAGADLLEGPYEGLDLPTPPRQEGWVSRLPRAAHHVPALPDREVLAPATLGGVGERALSQPAQPPVDFELSGLDLSGIEPPFGLDSLEHDQIKTYVHFYMTDGRRRLARLLSRAGRHADYLRGRLREAGLPEELLYLVMIESGFDQTARSRAGAVGLWQFIPRTGRGYGLEVGRRYDERRDRERATDAAIEYLRSLYDRFGSWPLAMAAYNAGSGHVRGELVRYNLNDFWSMDGYSAIYDDTRRYVVKIIAAAIVGENPERFGFDAVVPEAPLAYETVEVPGGRRLSGYARAAGVEVDELMELNPALLVASLPDVESYPLHLPVGTLDRFLAEYDELDLSETGEHQLHRLRFGETVEDVAAACDLPERDLRGANGLGRGERLAYATEVVVPIGAEATGCLSSLPAPMSDPGERPVVVTPAIEFAYPDRRRVFYEVRDDDRPRAIAGAFGVSVHDLAMWNDIDLDAELLEGMTLQLYVPRGADLSGVRYLTEDHLRPLALGSVDFREWDQAEERSRQARRRYHTVRRGDSLSSIAHRYGVRTRDLMRWNDLDDPDRIRSGQRLRVH